ncbi:hypothetical protein JTB14_032019 [Gonioctena quinquepunctata]|nr:hypothetical protein JTB14_032019 [Gonioctena quinquepunctata]
MAFFGNICIVSNLGPAYRLGAPLCSKDSDIKTRKRKLEPLKQSELENLANNLDEISDLEDPYSSDDSVYDKAYDPEDDSEIDESEDSLDCDSQLDENETAEETQIVQSSGEIDEEVVSNTIADQRNISDEELWVSENEEPPEIAFLAQPCYNIHLPDDAKPIDYFYLTFSQDILDIVVQETNRQGEETKPKTTRSRKNNENNWKELTVSELKQFLGLCCLGGYWVFMDNYYNSVSLADNLVKNKTYVTGTLNPKWKDNPKSLIKKTLKKGEAAIKRKGPGSVTSWKDRQYVRMITTGHKHQMVEVTNRRGVKSKKPECIVSYNKYMSGIDRWD